MPTISFDSEFWPTYRSDETMPPESCHCCHEYQREGETGIEILADCGDPENGPSADDLCEVWICDACTPRHAKWQIKR
jgi:hypothetical protein